MAAVAAAAAAAPPYAIGPARITIAGDPPFSVPIICRRRTPLKSSILPLTSTAVTRRPRGFPVACLPSSLDSPRAISTRLFVSGLSFRTTDESLRNAFQNFGELVEVNLVMDRIANRPRGFAFLRYATEEESRKAIEGMHGKFLDGRVIFVEVAKPRGELRPTSKPPPRKLY